MSLKTIIKLTNSNKNTTIGNHAVIFHTDGKRFLYHGNIVCRVNDVQKTFTLDDCGYSGYPSTTRTLNSYRQELTIKGYREIKI